MPSAVLSRSGSMSCNAMVASASSGKPKRSESSWRVKTTLPAPTKAMVVISSIRVCPARMGADGYCRTCVRYVGHCSECCHSLLGLGRGVKEAGVPNGDRSGVEALRHLPIRPEEKGFGGPRHRRRRQPRSSCCPAPAPPTAGWAVLEQSCGHRPCSTTSPPWRGTAVTTASTCTRTARRRWRRRWSRPSWTPGRPGSPSPPSHSCGCSRRTDSVPGLSPTRSSTRPAPPGWGARWRTRAPRRQLLRRQRRGSGPARPARGGCPRCGHRGALGVLVELGHADGRTGARTLIGPSRWPRRWRPPARWSSSGWPATRAPSSGRRLL